MPRYKIVYKGESLRWQEGCPVVVEAQQIVRDTETTQCYLQLKLKNISSHKVGALSINSFITYQDGSAQTLEQDFLDADIEIGSCFKPSPIELEASQPTSVETLVTQADSRPASRNVIKVNPQKKASVPNDLCDIRTKLLANAGCKYPDKTNYVFEDNGTWWKCICGQLNYETEKCCSCKVDKTEAASANNQDHLKEALLEKAVSLSSKKDIESLKQAADTYETLSKYGIDRRESTEVKEKFAAKKKRIAMVIAGCVAVFIVLMLFVAHFSCQQAYDDKLQSIKTSSETTLNLATVSIDPDTSSILRAYISSETASSFQFPSTDGSAALKACYAGDYYNKGTQVSIAVYNEQARFVFKAPEPIFAQELVIESGWNFSNCFNVNTGKYLVVATIENGTIYAMEVTVV